jgi:hypothetical protein
MKYMKSKKNDLFEREHQAWESRLEFFNQEHALLKYRISELVDSNEDHQFLQMAEYFQNELLLKDEMLNKLTKELREFSENVKQLPNINPLSQNMIDRYEILRNEMLDFEKSSLKLSREFNKRMLQAK